MAAFKVSVLKTIMVNPYFDLDFLMNDFIGYQVVPDILPDSGTIYFLPLLTLN